MRYVKCRLTYVFFAILLLVPTIALTDPIVWRFTEIVRDDSAPPQLPVPAVEGNTTAFTVLPFVSSVFHVPSGRSLVPGVYLDVAGSLSEVAHQGDLLPNGASGFMDEFSPPTLNQGKVAFYAATMGFSGEEGSGLFSNLSGTLQTVANTATPVPDGTGTFTNLEGIPSLDDGQIVFLGTDSAGQEGLYRFDGEALAVVANRLTPVPNSSGQFFFTNFTFIPSLDNGLVAFGGFSSSEDGTFNALGTGIYLADENGIMAVVQPSTPIPGQENTVFPVFAFQISPDLEEDSVSFLARNEMGQFGVYLSRNGVLELVADTQTRVPEGTANFTGFGQWTAVSAGNVAFIGSTSEEDGLYGLYALIGDALVRVIDARSYPLELLPEGARSGEIVLLDGLSFSPEGLDGASLAFAVQNIVVLEDQNDFVPLFQASQILRADLAGLQFPDFTDAAVLRLNGSASIDQGVLELTPDEPSQVGSAFFAAPVTIDSTSSFTTRFTFRISGVRGSSEEGADGLAFVIHNDPAGGAALGNSGEGLGFGINQSIGSSESISPSMAIEFDTFQNGFDPDNNHVALILNGQVPDHEAVSGLPCPGQCLNSDLPGQPVSIWIDYNGASDLLQIFLSQEEQKPDTPLLSTFIDLFATVGERAFFGFTGGSGARFNSHAILNWELALSEAGAEPAPGDIDGDGDVDRADLNVLIAARNTPASGPDDPRDLDGDGTITVLDGRKLATLCSRPRCATEP